MVMKREKLNNTLIINHNRFDNMQVRADKEGLSYIIANNYVVGDTRCRKITIKGDGYTINEDEYDIIKSFAEAMIHILNVNVELTEFHVDGDK
jgi:hypothetical protein